MVGFLGTTTTALTPTTKMRDLSKRSLFTHFQKQIQIWGNVVKYRHNLNIRSHLNNRRELWRYVTVI